ncbi:S8 family serine peptidase [Streptomyces sp. LMG1-1-1.1]|uniref:S8 family serine peptidase n=1 Tax=Streptomyces sp. LMG1-1-1.1 TaxID=3135245 RepID=UPI003465034D
MNRRRITALSSLAAATALAFQGVVSPSVRAADEPDRMGRYIVVLDDTAGADPTALAGRQLRGLGRGPSPRAVFRYALKGYAADLTPAQAARLGQASGVRFVAPERTYRPATRPVRPPAVKASAARAGAGGEVAPVSGSCRTAVDVTRRQCLPEWADRIEADESSTRSGDGRGAVAGVNVAVIDTGITGGHPDLNVRGGTDCVTGSPVVPGAALSDPLLFGTSLAGIVGARDNGIGVVGTAPGAPLWSYKVFPDDGRDATDAALLCALDRVAASRADADPGNDVHVATMAFASTNLTPADDGRCGAVLHDALHQAVCAATRAGVTLVAAAGSFRFDIAVAAPASYDEVLTATAMADFDGRPGGGPGADCRGDDMGGFGFADDQVAIPLASFARAAADRRHLVAAPGVCVATTPPVGEPLPLLVTGTGPATAVAAGTTALCVAVRRCPVGDPARTIRTVVGDAAHRQLIDARHGYYGDPGHPIRGRYYGPLLAADRY